jgi:GTP-binding protein HflX
MGIDTIKGLQPQEKAILVGVATQKIKSATILEHLAELQRLAETAEAVVVETVMQKMQHYNSSTLIGSGKLEEIRQLCQIHDSKLVIFDQDLTGSQVRNIEKVLEGIKIMDRSGIILDIFARHAKTAEAHIMVEIAQMNYMLPRLTRAWTHLSRQVGGIGTKGPGETQLESDRRLVQHRVTELKKKLKKIELARATQAERRNSIFHAAIVGYTNAGKSTLTNCLTNAGVLVENKLFATLDSTTRKLYLEQNKPIVLSDTVGFIRKLPHHLVASFRSTLAVAGQANLIIHVIDADAFDFKDHMEVTHQVLSDLVEPEIPRLNVFNKMDRVDSARQGEIEELYPDSVRISAKEEIGLDLLKKRVLEFYNAWERTDHD